MQDKFKLQLTEWVKYPEELIFVIKQLKDKPYKLKTNKTGASDRMCKHIPETWVAVFVEELEGPDRKRKFKASSE